MTKSLCAKAQERQFRHRALLLLARRHGGTPDLQDKTEQDIQRWMTGSEQHRQAMQWAEQAWAACHAEPLQTELCLPDAVHPGRRRALGSVITLALAGLGLLSWRSSSDIQHLSIATRRQQLYDTALSDGSQLSVAPLSQLRLEFTAEHRELYLIEGEFHIDVKTEQRPFVVMTALGLIEVIGTAFSVGLQDNLLSVEVERGQVRFVSTQGEGRVLTAGHAVQVRANVFYNYELDPSSVAAWRTGWLVFADTPLPEVLAQWRRFSDQAILLEDNPDLIHMRISGRFSVTDPLAFLRSLAQVLPVKVKQEKNAWRVISIKS